MPFNEKLRELALYVAAKSEDDPRFGATKLNKILFYSDFWAYGLFGKPITGAEYQRLENGPAPRAWLPLQRDMLKQKEAAVARRAHFGYQQERLVALREPKLEAFSGAEISIVDQVLEMLRDQNATQVSELSHQFQGWRLARHKETIPYATVFLEGSRPLTEAELAHGQRVAAEAGGSDVAAA